MKLPSEEYMKDFLDKNVPLMDSRQRRLAKRIIKRAFKMGQIPKDKAEESLRMLEKK